MTLPSFRLDEQTALVTGAASGIGRGIALGLAAAGANVACFDLPESALDLVCGEIRAAGRGAIAVPGDVMDADMLADAVRDAESEFGPLILAVNSAGIANAAPAEPQYEDQRMVVGLVRFAPGARTAWHSHAKGQTLHVTHGIARMQARGGDIIEVQPGQTVYTPPGEEHWHGATPDDFMEHLAMLENSDNPNATTTWGQHVTDEEYNTSPQ